MLVTCELVAHTTVKLLSEQGSRASKSHIVWLILCLVLIGFVLGAAVGWLTGYVTYQPCSQNPYACSYFGREFDESIGAVVGAAVGVFAVPILWLLWRVVRGLTENPRSRS